MHFVGTMYVCVCVRFLQSVYFFLARLKLIFLYISLLSISFSLDDAFRFFVYDSSLFRSLTKMFAALRITVVEISE